MFSLVIKEHDDFLGNFLESLKVADTEHFQFQPSNDGAFCMSKKTKDSTIKMMITGKKIRKVLTKNEILIQIK